MSRIGKKPISIPSGVTIKVDGDLVLVKGPKGELKMNLSPGVKLVIEDNKVSVQVDDLENKVLWGLNRALLNNMIEGVSKGFEKVLEFTGVGFKAQVKGQELELNIGYTHPVTVKAPEGINFAVEKNTIKVSGINKEIVGHIAAMVRAARLPEPYKGTGIKYQDEIIIRKAGKKAVTGA